MSALVVILRSEVRERWRGLVVLAVLLGIAGGVVFAAVAGGRRTETALDRFRSETNAADVNVQTDDPARGRALLAAALAMPEVADAGEYITIPLGIESELTGDPALQLPVDDRYTRTIGRARVLEGRLPDGAADDEVVVSELFKEATGIEVGERLPLPTFTPDDLARVFAEEGKFPGFRGPAIDARVVGVVRVPEDAHGSAVSGGPAVTGTPAMYERYAGKVGALEGSFLVDLHDPNKVDVLARRMREVAGEDAELFVDSADDFYAASGRDALRVMAYGLYLFGALAGLAALVVAGQTAGRERQHSRGRVPAWRAIGLSRAQSIGAIVGPQALAGAVGALLAVGIAYAASPVFPFGFARETEPDPGVRFDAFVLLGGALVLFVVAIGSAFALEALRPRAESRGIRRSAEGRWRVKGSAPVDLGVGLATSRGYGVSAATAVAVALAGVVGAAVYSVNLHDLIDTPSRWGWNVSSSPDVDVEADERDQLIAALRADPDIADAALGRHVAVDVEGQQVHALSLDSPASRPAATLLSGRAPGPREVVLGERTLRRIDRDVGDVVSFRDRGGRTEALTVVGSGSFPLVENVHPGDGAWLSPETLERLAVSDGESDLVLTYRDGVDVDAVEARLAADYPLGFSIYSRARVPGQLRNLDRVAGVGPALAIFFALVGVVGLANALVVSVRRRQRDYAVMRALGFRPRDLRRSVRWQSFVSVALGVAIGVPVGVLVGRVVWYGIVGDLSIDDRARWPLVALLMASVAAIFVAAAVALLPAHRAASVSTTALREE